MAEVERRSVYLRVVHLLDRFQVQMPISFKTVYLIIVIDNHCFLMYVSSGTSELLTCLL
jgi:hypothetical protein